MKIGMKIGDLMTRDFTHVSPNMNLKECAKMMMKKRVGSLIIKEKNILKGILTEKDIVWAVSKKSKKDLADIEVKDLMRRKVITIKPSADIADAMQKFKKKKVRRLPVIENGKLIGIITANDILRIDPCLFQIIAETIKIREETEKLNRSHINASRKQEICEEYGELDILYYNESQWLCERCYNKQ